MDIVTLAASMKLNGGIAHYKASLDVLLKILARDTTSIGATLTLPEEVEVLGPTSLAGLPNVTTTLVAPEVTTLGSAFVNGGYFTEMYFPKVTSVVGGSFANVSNQYTARFDALETIPDAVFAGSAAKKIILPSAKTIGAAFSGCSKLTEVYIGPDCTEIGSAFGGAGTSGKTLTINCGFSEGTISGTSWYAGAVGTVVINYNVPIPT